MIELLLWRACCFGRVAWTFVTMLGGTLECFGMRWDALGCFMALYDALGGFVVLRDVFGVPWIAFECFWGALRC